MKKEAALVVLVIGLLATILMAIPALAAELKAGVSGKGQWYQVGSTHGTGYGSGRIYYNGPTASLTVKTVEGQRAKVTYTWSAAPDWKINNAGSMDYDAIVADEGGTKRIKFTSPSGNEFSFIFDPVQPKIKGECRTKSGLISNIEMSPM